MSPSAREVADRPTFEEVAAAAEGSSLVARYLPVTAGKVTDADAARCGNLLTHHPSLF